ncbi:MAG: hypothetical protein JAY72_07965 [Candidatus Thiodiazotropha endolucinida]|nr:hypothetical protein [Candidatus Thiodiazotropha taylori]MCW4321602.1 hypothetical protein [Candidatus Thiodiazotropha taylori]
MGNSIKDYYTVTSDKNTTKCYLVDPLTKSQTEDYLLIRSMYSKGFLAEKRKMLEDFASSRFQKRKTESVEEMRIKAAALLVVGWSFSQDFSHHAMQEALENAPQLVDQIEQVAESMENFFSQPKNLSKNT